MKRTLTAFVFVGLAAGLIGTLSGCPIAIVGETLYKSIDHDGRARTYRIHIPENPRAPAPLLLVLHGGGGDAFKTARFTGFDALAEQQGFIVAYPEGVLYQWNDGRAAPGHPAFDEDIDDVGFINALIDHLAVEYAIDEDAIYVTGPSNGGMMTLRLACELTGRFAAAAPVIASLPEPLAPECIPSGVLPLLMINATDDQLIPWDGGEVAWRNHGRIIPVEDTLEFWVLQNQCDTEPEAVWLDDRDTEDGTRVWRETYSGGAGSAEVIFYGIEGGGHTWPGGPDYQMQWLLGTVCQDFDASETIWAFFDQHRQ